MNTSKMFENELNYICNDTLRNIVADTLDASPECIQTIPASSSKRYHPEYAVVVGHVNDDGSVYEGGLMRHVKAAVGIAHSMIETNIFKGIALPANINDKEIIETYKDSAYAAIILHDCCKPDDTEKHGTRFDHPLLAAKLFKEAAVKYITKDNMDYMKMAVPLVHGAIASHMGEWNTAPYAKGIVLPTPQSGIERFVHICDYLASRKFLIFDFDKYDYNSRG